MKKQTTLAVFASLLAATISFAGTTSKSVIQPTPQSEGHKWWAIEVGTGYDSLYIFRGFNALRADRWYGHSLYWTSSSFSLMPTENDTFTTGLWAGFGMDGIDYRELDVTTSYTRTFGNLALTFGYAFYYVYNDGPFYSHELNVGTAYNITLGSITLTPAINYFINLGPDLDNEGIAEAGSSFLQFRLDSAIPVYKEIIALEPYAALNLNFRYNLDEEGENFSGLNNFEFGLGLPIQILKFATLRPYAAFTQVANPDGIFNTQRSLFWTGVALNLSF